MKKEKIIGLEDRLFMIQELMLGSVVFNIGVSREGMSLLSVRRIRLL